MGNSGDKSFQSITCTGTDNFTITTKRQNTQITQNNTMQKGALVISSAQQTHSKKSRLRERTDRAWFSHLAWHSCQEM